jgi:predicted AAA+ superfamily ATPase
MVIDSGLAAHLNGIEADWLNQQLGGNALGPLLEGFVMAELLKQRTWSATRWELLHFRDRTGPEVDAVVRLADGRVILIEVKASQTYRSEHFTTMKALSERLGEQLLAGIVLTLSDHPYQFGTKLWGLPVSSLWSLGRDAVR